MLAEGDRVQRRSDRSKVGTVVRLVQEAANEGWYEVEFAGRIEILPERDLEPYKLSKDPRDLFIRQAFGDRDDLRRLLTFHKLDSPVDNTLYSLEGSRTEFYPHQYKPLLKFLASDRQKLLIADEVGLGKTIEAGLIMIEQRQRDLLSSVLVVCPSALRLKWRDELWRRFDEDFRFLNNEDFRQLLDDMVERESLAGLRGIISLETLRNRRNLELLEAARPHLDLLIVDEAHHLRNRETLSHRVCLQLSEAASAVLLLTATPIQLGTENLFNLFRVIDSTEFNDFEVFQRRLEANEPVVEAHRLARACVPPPAEEIRVRLDALGRGQSADFFTNNPIYNRLRHELSENPPTDHFQTVELQRDLERLNLLGDVFTRTKKRDVQYDAPVRRAEVLRPPMSPSEEAFYDAVTDFVRGHAQPGTPGGFALMAAQRQTASCLPAVRYKFLERALRVREIDHDHEESDLEADEFEELPRVATKEEVKLSKGVIAAANGLGDEDTKYNELRRLLRELERERPGEKVLLFAFYKGTLRYLKRRLEEDGLGCEIIHGDIPSHPGNLDEDERTQRINNFRNNPRVQVLLSSEVGSEGLDFQFCHIIINYDLPWNPMRVEQRIGRLDRLGQKSGTILIFNFSVPGTIEDRVLTRLYERIGIFERSIGDLEIILGEEIRELQKELLTKRLTPEEEDQRIERAALAIERRETELQELEKEAATFVGVDDHLERELERIRSGGELLTPEDRAAFFLHFVERRYPNAHLGSTRVEGVYRLEIPFELEADVSGLRNSLARRRFLSAIRDGEVELTFSAKVAYEDDRVEFLTASHPLIELAVKHFESNPEQLHPATAFRVPASETVGPGTYALGVFAVTIQGGRERKRLDPLFLRLDGDEFEPVPDERARRFFGEVLQANEVTSIDTVPTTVQLSAAADELIVEFVRQLEVRMQDLEERNAARVETRLVSLRATHENALSKQQDLLRRARENERQPRYIRMIEGTIRNMETRFEARRRQIEGEKEITFSPSLIACGLIEVGGDT